MEVGKSSLNDYTSSILRRRLRMSSQHPPKNIISDPNKGTQNHAFSAFVSLLEPKDIKEAILEPEWIIAMQNELNEFEKKTMFGI